MASTGRESDTRWFAGNFDQLLKTAWDDEIFVYNPASNQTHLLNQVAFVVLSHLASQPQSLPELIDRFLPEAPEQDKAYFAQQLEQLALIGLICPHKH